MRAIILTSDKGKKFPAADIDKKREAAKSGCLESSGGYVEILGTVGRLNAAGERIEEHCYVIESLDEFKGADHV